MTLSLLAALVITSAAAPVYGQQPAPAPPPQPPPAVETPEAEASRDIERMGEIATKNKAVYELDAALKAAQILTEKRKTQSGGWVKNCRSDDPEIKELRDAVRYYARAHGLPSNVDDLIDELEMYRGIVVDSGFGRPGEERHNDTVKRWGHGIWTMSLAVIMLRDIKACEAKAAEPPRTGVADPPEGKGGLSKNAKIGIAAGAGAVLVGVLAGGGSEGTPGAAIAPTPPPPLSPFNPAGTYDVTLSVRTDPGGNAPRIGMEPALVLVFTVSGSTGQYTCPPGSHINPGSGPVDLVSGAFNFAGVGSFAGRPSVQFLFPGTFGRDGTITGEYRVGTGGELGGITTFAVNGRRRQ